MKNIEECMKKCVECLRKIFKNVAVTCRIRYTNVYKSKSVMSVLFHSRHPFFINHSIQSPNYPKATNAQHNLVHPVHRPSSCHTIANHPRHNLSTHVTRGPLLTTTTPSSTVETHLCHTPCIVHSTRGMDLPRKLVPQQTNDTVSYADTACVAQGDMWNM